MSKGTNIGAVYPTRGNMEAAGRAEFSDTTSDIGYWNWEAHASLIITLL